MVLLLLMGLRYAPLLLVSKVVHGLWVKPVGLSAPLLTVDVLVTSGGYFAVVYVLLRRVRIDPRLLSQRDMEWFVGLACVAGPMLVTLIQVGVLWWSDAVPAAELLPSVAGSWARGSAKSVRRGADLQLRV